MRRGLALWLIGATLISLPAMAAETNHSANNNSKHAISYQLKPSQWRDSKLKGLDVYNAQNQKIGSINELILNRDGKVDAVVIGVGGFLGMGEHNVAVPFNEVRWVDQPVRGQSASGSSNPPPKNPPSNETREAYRGYPDHAVVNMTKDQLKALPEIQYSK